MGFICRSTPVLIRSYCGSGWFRWLRYRGGAALRRSPSSSSGLTTRWPRLTSLKNFTLRTGLTSRKSYLNRNREGSPYALTSVRLVFRFDSFLRHHLLNYLCYLRVITGRKAHQEFPNDGRNIKYVDGFPHQHDSEPYRYKTIFERLGLRRSSCLRPT